MSDLALQGRKGPHRGWLVTACCFFMAIFGWGTVFYGHSLYMSALKLEHGWTTGQISGAISFFWIVGIPMTVTVGGLIDRFGPRLVTATGAILVGSSVIGLGQVTALWQAYLCFAVMAIGYPAVGAVGISATLGAWFDKGLSVAMSFALTGASVGAMLVVPAMARIAEAQGFSQATLVMGGLTVAVVAPLCLIFMSRPVADTVVPTASVPALKHLKATAGMPVFWIIVAASGISLAAQVGFLSHQIPILEERLSRTDAADAVAVTAAAGVIGRFGLGFLAERYDLRAVALVAYALQGIGIAALNLAGDGFWLYAACALSGFVVGCLVILPPLLIRRWLGPDGYGKNYGLLAVFAYLCQGIGPGSMGLIHDWAGVYEPALWYLVALLAVSMVVITRLGPPPPAAGGR
ncbi:MAG: MFS transporter [Minwuia sp.]|uniref:MFS transporter n=1 Tax=Minwuia sp. TaxID=2493630 RepID=UPI003A8A07FE